MPSRELCLFAWDLNHSAMGRRGEIMNVLAVFSFIILLAVGAAAQSSTIISGRITVNDKPISVLVILQRNNAEIDRTTSNSNGEYQFQNVTDGKYRLKLLLNDATVFRIGNDSKDITVGNSSPVTADFPFTQPPLPPGSNSSAISETVTVSAGESQPIEQVSKTVDVISAQEMRDRADFSLVDTLRTIPGFRVQQLGGFGRTATIKSRGLRNQDTAILLDGIRFRDASAITGDASPFLGDLTLTSVSKIEVMRGSGSSLYGTNAIGGTVDLQSPRPPSGTHGQVSFAAGGMGLTRFRGNLSHGLENGKFGIGAGFSRTVYTKGVDGQDNASNTNFQTRAEFSPFSQTNISARVFISDAKVRLNSSPDTFGTLPSTTAVIINAVPNVTFTPDANDPDSFQHSKFQNVQVAVNQAVNSVLVIAGYYQGLHTSRRNDDGILGAGFQSAFTSNFSGTINTANVHATWTPIRQNTLTAGYEFEHEKFGNNGGTPDGVGNFSTLARQSSNTFYVQDLVELFEQRLQLSGAFRVQSFSLARPSCGSVSCASVFNTRGAAPASYTGDASAAYLFKRAGTKFRAHIGNGYREPSLYERFGTYFFLNAFFPLGNPALKPERSTAVDAGIEQTLLRDRLKLSATYFYTLIKDEITYLPTDDFGAPAYYNFDKHFSRGYEFSGTVKPSASTDVFASYTFTNSDVRNFRRQSFPVGPVSSSDGRAFGIPDHQLTLVVTQRFRRAWINFDLLATSSYLAPIFSNSTFTTYVFRFAGNRKGDLTAGYTFRIGRDSLSLRLFGTIENVFDQEYFENGFRTARRSGRVGLALGF
jgi:vitamin B12 transporter